MQVKWHAPTVHSKTPTLHDAVGKMQAYTQEAEVWPQRELYRLRGHGVEARWAPAGENLTVFTYRFERQTVCCKSWSARAAAEASCRCGAARTSKDYFLLGSTSSNGSFEADASGESFDEILRAWCDETYSPIEAPAVALCLTIACEEQLEPFQHFVQNSFATLGEEL